MIIDWCVSDQKDGYYKISLHKGVDESNMEYVYDLDFGYKEWMNLENNLYSDDKIRHRIILEDENYIYEKDMEKLKDEFKPTVIDGDFNDIEDVFFKFQQEKERDQEENNEQETKKKTTNNNISNEQIDEYKRTNKKYNQIIDVLCEQKDSKKEKINFCPKCGYKTTEEN